jgi:hypothetical protein
MPVEVRLHFTDGSEETQRWDGQSEQEQITFQIQGRKAEYVEVDPERWLLDVKRYNNTASVPARSG